MSSQQLSYSVVDPVTGIAPHPPEPAIGGGLSLDTGYGDLGYGDLGYGDLGYGDLGYGDLGYGDLGYGDLGYGDLGYGDLGAPEPDGTLGTGEVSLDTAITLGNTPTGLTAEVVCPSEDRDHPHTECDKDRKEKEDDGVRLNWQAPNVGAVLRYKVFRVTGTSVTPQNLASRALIATVPGDVTSLIDESRLKRGTSYTYFVVATLPTLQSGASNFATVKF